jgi:nitroimidazol reductase NimA-like FMN-containing flavoprotein (pyridoxamine 5'-phosphate oxidase superfamily)
MIDHQSNAEQRSIDALNCHLLLASQHVGRLVVPGNAPSIVPLNYVVVDEVVYFRTDAGSAAARGHGTVAVFEVDVLDDLGHAGWSVVARGLVEDVTDWAATSEDLVDRLRPWAPGPKDRWMRLTVEEITGRWVRGEQEPWAPDERGYL